ncbi:TlyA family RNA methyltransferase [Allofustis seminis]|uniref:TlyA family RNA methyltransferase n=1 Tax=Allofustis seminis TaxID=166939 RepID=UPI00036C5E23|nr:TlyA family RNA methyltransferase [Allofustis seminis]
MTNKKRVDELLVQQNLIENVDQARRLIMTGNVLTSKNEKVYTAGEMYSPSEIFRIKGDMKEYVSRGGNKLAHAINHFDISLSNATVLDIGSSTGGFTDVCLQAGAKLVYALDVGTNQLHWKLRTDPRVISMEQTNFRYATLADFKYGRPHFACTDVSFISLAYIFPPLTTILPIGGELVALIKPQFEARKEDIEAGGIVRRSSVYEYVLKNCLQAAKAAELNLLGLTLSPIKGSKGNVEFLSYFRREKIDPEQCDKYVHDEIARVLCELKERESNVKTFKD